MSDPTSNSANDVSVQEFRIETWEEFTSQVAGLRRTSLQPLLFRGQANASWGLNSTLERRAKSERLPIREYYRLIKKIKPQIETFTGLRWEVPTFEEIDNLAYEYREFSRALATELPAYTYLA